MAASRYLLQSKPCSVFMEADTVSVKKIILIKDDTTLMREHKKGSCSYNGFPMKDIIDSFKRYFAGERVDFFYDCDLSSHTPFERKILNIVKGIPYGSTMTYGEVAKKAGNKNLSRAVGRAVSKNLTPIIIPCHRVLGSGGKLTGFSADGGVILKEELLRLEGALCHDSKSKQG